MALILGDEITHRDLVPVFDGFLKDLDEVKIGVLKHLADFLRVRDNVFLRLTYCVLRHHWILFALSWPSFVINGHMSE